LPTEWARCIYFKPKNVGKYKLQNSITHTLLFVGIVCNKYISNARIMYNINL